MANWFYQIVEKAIDGQWTRNGEPLSFSPPLEDDNKVLNIIGKEGWELTAVLPLGTAGAVRYYFKQAQ